MIILTYDIKDDKLWTKFSKFILSYGRRLQFSVYEINNSERILKIVESEIKHKFEKKFSQDDSVLIFKLSNNCKIIRFGYAKNEERDLVIF
ncbi:MAG: CRISPR-associated endonuclease Cas2 [Nanoarchaeota archaeon]|nr:CRISPR-associated endonuclease Cas2 [Nanoarchaeota archaeon]